MPYSLPPRTWTQRLFLELQSLKNGSDHLCETAEQVLVGAGVHGTDEHSGWLTLLVTGFWLLEAFQAAVGNPEEHLQDYTLRVTAYVLSASVEIMALIRFTSVLVWMAIENHIIPARSFAERLRDGKLQLWEGIPVPQLQQDWLAANAFPLGSTNGLIHAVEEQLLQFSLAFLSTLFWPRAECQSSADTTIYIALNDGIFMPPLVRKPNADIYLARPGKHYGDFQSSRLITDFLVEASFNRPKVPCMSGPKTERNQSHDHPDTQLVSDLHVGILDTKSCSSLLPTVQNNSDVTELVECASARFRTATMIAERSACCPPVFL